MPAELSDIPETGEELEDYVAALFLAAGHFVEKNVTNPNLLELDIVATDYETDPPRVILAEAKSGKWGYSDLFKVIGWMRYLKIREGAFFCQGMGDKDEKRVKKVFEPLDLAFADLNDFDDPVHEFVKAGLPAIHEPEEVTHWRWVHAVERLLAKKLMGLVKTAQSTGPLAVLDYQRLVNDGIFFERRITGRLRKLYGAYQSHPRLALSCAREMDGHPFEPEVFFFQKSDRIPEAFRGEHLLLQAAFYAEHRAKLAILKAAIDLAARRPKATERLLNPGIRRGIPGIGLPGTFIDGLRWLTEQPTYKQYARLWQAFLWSWGGFYLLDRRKEEFALLSDASGVPPEEIGTALKAFDEFFPAGSSWLSTHGWSQIRLVKMVPAVFRGLGAVHRLQCYELDKYRDLGYFDYTASDLGGWHNQFVAFLSGEQPPE